MIEQRMTNKEVKRKNRNAIFRYICKHDTISNPEISYGMKLSLPTVTQNTKELLKMGVIQETGELESTGGRRAKALSPVPNARYAIGLDIMKNHIGILLTNLLGEILEYERSYCPFELKASYFEELNQRVKKFLEEKCIQDDVVLGIGISFPGIVDLQKKEITNSHILNVKELPFSEVETFFEYPCYFLNDANAGAFAEGIHSKQSDKFFYVSLSNTVGGAIFYEEKLVQGTSFRCGEVGHMTIIPDGKECYCGKKGCFDAYCSAKQLADLADGKLEEFFIQLKKRSEITVKAWQEYIYYLAIAVNNIHMVLDCDVILGGYVGSYLEEYIQDIRKEVANHNTFEEKGEFVRNCNYKVAAAAYGAAMKVIEEFIEKI